MLRRHVRLNFCCRLLSSSTKTTSFFVNATSPSPFSFVRNFFSSTSILLQKQQEQTKLLKIPPADYSMCSGELRVIYKLADFLSGRDKIPGGQGVAARFASKEVLALTEKLGRVVLTFAEIPLDNEKNSNDDLPTAFRCALALAVFIFDRSSIISDGEFQCCRLALELKEIMPNKELDYPLHRAIATHMDPVVDRCEEALTLELFQNPEQQQQDVAVKKFVERVLASSRIDVNTAFNQASARKRRVADDRDVCVRRPVRKRESGVLNNYCRDVVSLRKFDVTTCVTPIPGFRAGLTKLLEGIARKRSSQRKALETALVGWFDHNKKANKNNTSKIFGDADNELVVNLTVDKFSMRDDVTTFFNSFAPEVTVMLRKHQNRMGRVAILQLENPSDSESMHNISRLLNDVSAALVENPFRSAVYGIITNGTFVRMFRVRRAKSGSFEKVFQQVVCECDPANAKANREKLLDCFEWLLTRTPEQLGFAPLPSFNVDSKSGEVTMVTANSTKRGSFTLGAYLGKGESCRVYVCVPTERAEDDAHEKDRTFFANSFVAKWYCSDVAAQLEKSMYEKIASANIQNTTRIAGYDADHRVMFVKPEGVHFRGPNNAPKKDAPQKQKLVPPKKISASHVNCLIDAVQALHRAGIVHCDIQPQNLFCVAAESADKAVLNDFGRSHFRENLEFREFRAFMSHDYRSLARSIAFLQGGEQAWNEAMSTRRGRREKLTPWNYY